MSKYDDVYFVGDNQAINRVRVGSSKTRNRGAFSGSLAALISNGFCDICELLMLIANLTTNSDYSHTYSDRFTKQ